MSGSDLKRAIAGEHLPCALVDLTAFDENAARLIGPLAARQKTLRLATKSIRCPALVERLRDRNPEIRGLMTYTATETAFWAERGWTDLLLAYPVVQASDAQLLARLNAGATAAVVVDDVDQIGPLAAAGTAAGTRIPLVIEVDLAYRAMGLHLGVRRSPLRETGDIVALARRIAATPGLRFHGLMGYEAQIAGLTDDSPFERWMDLPKRAIKRLSRPRVERTRAELSHALATAGLPATVVNGGGTGSLSWCVSEPALTEVTAGSGFLAGHLFDYYRDLALLPALYFALEITRRPAPDLVTCLGGGWIASGGAGADRLPLPAWPEGLHLLPREGAGEVQTPLAVPAGVHLALGEPVFFRPAKSGELAEHFTEYLLVQGAKIVARAPTYRGLGKCFL